MGIKKVEWEAEWEAKWEEEKQAKLTLPTFKVVKSDFKKSCCYYYQGFVYAQVEKKLFKCDFERKWLILSTKKTQQ